MKNFYCLFIVAVIGFLFISSGLKAAPKEGAQYDYRRWSCKIEKEKAQEITQMKVTIFNQRGDDYNNVVLSENRFIKVKDFSLRVLDSAGNVIMTKKFSDLIKTCGFGSDYQVYSDVCYYSYEVSYPKYPYSIEYQYTSDIKSLMFWDGQYFQANIPVINTSYELIFPTEFQFDYKTYGMQVELSRSEEKGMQKWVWNADSLAAYEDVDYAPADYPEAGRLVFRPNSFAMEGYKFSGKEWSDIGKWYADLTRDRFLKPDSDSILSSSSEDDKSGQLKRIYDKVVNDNRYVSVIIGISGWRPNDAALVAQRGYGDCKDLSTLLISRLRNAGYKANPVLVLTKSAGKVDLDFPSFRFNHVITEVTVGDGTILMDPTCHNCPFGEIPAGDEDIPVLVVEDSGGYVRMTSSSRPERNQFIKKSNIYMDRAGQVKVKAELTYTGNYSFSEKEELSHLDKEETKSYVNRLLSGGSKKFTLQRYDISNLDDRDKALVLNLEAIRNRPSDTIKEVIYLEFDAFESMSSYESLNLKDRTVPLNLGYPHIKEQNIVIKWDTLLVLDSIVLPSGDSANYDFGKMRCRFEKAGDSIMVFVSRSYGDYVLPMGKFAEFAAFREKLRGMSNKFIKFYRKTR